MCGGDLYRGGVPMSGAFMLEQVLKQRTGVFAILHRPDANGTDCLDILFGETSTPAKLADIVLPDRIRQNGTAEHQALVLIPHQQITERGFAAIEDGSPLIAMSVTGQGQVSLSEALRLLPDEPIALADVGFDIEDDAYADIVRAVQRDEIGTGEGSNFVIKRSFVATITNYSIKSELSLFRRLLMREAGAYWTFLIHTGSRTFVGATPERHVSLHDGSAVMNPISGTYRYPPSGPDMTEILDFLANRKESDELYMVLDEELKMMAQVCDGGGRVVGPHLREMARLAHTEYYIEGRSNLDPREILRQTMFAPTVIGSPLENACRVIARYEPCGRGYYGGVAALIGRDADGAHAMDSAILIRTADISGSDCGNCGQLEVGVGATLVRHSEALDEVAETHTKVAGVLAALSGSVLSKNAVAPLMAGAHPSVQGALRRRNDKIASFWLMDTDTRLKPQSALLGRRALIIDAEDTFTAMLVHQLSAIGLAVEVARFDEPYRLEDHDLVVLGPGPGDPRDTSDPRLAHMSLVIDRLLAWRMPFLAVCLSHQLLSRRLGLELVRRDVPNQGIQREINLFGAQTRVGFYNSFVSLSHADKLECPGVGSVRISRDSGSGEVYAMVGPHFSSVQFHIESILTQDGMQIFSDLLTPLVPAREELVA
jgi:2-amino-4-deoxychorismate synthase